MIKTTSKLRGIYHHQFRKSRVNIPGLHIDLRVAASRFKRTLKSQWRKAQSFGLLKISLLTFYLEKIYGKSDVRPIYKEKRGIV